jgi:hypothetical protein
MPVTISGSGAITGLVIGTTDLADAAVTTPKIADAAVTLGKMANMATASVLGRNTAGTGAPEVLSAATTRTLIGADNASNLTSGTVATGRLATSGTASSSTYLRGDQTWATAGGAPAALGDIGTVIWAIVDTTSVIFPGSTVAGSSCYYPTAFSFTGGSSPYTEGTSAGSLPRQEYRITLINSGLGRANRIRSGNVGYSFSTTNMAALSGTWRVLLPVLARASSYDSCNNITEAQTSATLIQRIS